MSNCKNCGAPIIWVRRENGHGFYPPVDEPKGLTLDVKWDSNLRDFVGTPSAREFTSTLHSCNRGTIDYEYDLDTALDKVEEAVESAKARSIEITPELAVECPSCGAEPGEWCHTIKDYNKKATVLHRTRKV